MPGRSRSIPRRRPPSDRDGKRHDRVTRRRSARRTRAAAAGSWRSSSGTSLSSSATSARIGGGPSATRSRASTVVRLSDQLEERAHHLERAPVDIAGVVGGARRAGPSRAGPADRARSRGRGAFAAGRPSAPRSARRTARGAAAARRSTRGSRITSAQAARKAGVRVIPGPGCADRRQRIWRPRAAVRADRLVQPPLHALDGVVGVPGLRQLLLGQPVEERAVDVAVASASGGRARRSARSFASQAQHEVVGGAPGQAAPLDEQRLDGARRRAAREQQPGVGLGLVAGRPAPTSRRRSGSWPPRGPPPRPRARRPAATAVPRW